MVFQARRWFANPNLQWSPSPWFSNSFLDLLLLLIYYFICFKAQLLNENSSYRLTWFYTPFFNFFSKNYIPVLDITNLYKKTKKKPLNFTNSLYFLNYLFQCDNTLLTNEEFCLTTYYQPLSPCWPSKNFFGCYNTLVTT